MGSEWQRDGPAAVLYSLQHGECETIAATSQGDLGKLAHLAAELGVWEALKVIKVHRQRNGIPDNLVLHTLHVLRFA